jgi:hypothetical protein
LRWHSTLKAIQSFLKRWSIRNLSFANGTATNGGAGANTLARLNHILKI